MAPAESAPDPFLSQEQEAELVAPKSSPPAPPSSAWTDIVSFLDSPEAAIRTALQSLPTTDILRLAGGLPECNCSPSLMVRRLHPPPLLRLRLCLSVRGLRQRSHRPRVVGPSLPLHVRLVGPFRCRKPASPAPEGQLSASVPRPG